MAPMTPALAIDDLHVSVDDREILRGVSPEVASGSIHALMGPNGSGKSTLAQTLLANPAYRVTGGRILLKGEDITALPTDERVVGDPRCCCSATAGGRPSISSTSGTSIWWKRRRA